MKPTAREWVRKAENDFKVASPDAACFFFQQCIEKYLKACLVEGGRQQADRLPRKEFIREKRMKLCLRD
ncbi:MAG: HEPN domain-containing protein [Verrucomicrobia bacterium]|nr:HEPN domain-containing protein [Verrucomicrobiota bacterium]